MIQQRSEVIIGSKHRFPQFQLLKLDILNATVTLPGEPMKMANDNLSHEGENTSFKERNLWQWDLKT